MVMAPMVPTIRRSFVLKLSVLVSLIVVVTSALLGGIGYHFARNILVDEINHRLKGAVSDRHALLVQYVAQQHERVSLVASRTRFRQLVELYLGSEIEVEDFRTRSSRILRDAMASTVGFEEIWLADINGTVITATDENALGRNLVEDVDFQQGLKRRHLGVPQSVGDRWFAHLVAPAVSNTGKLLGVVMVWLDLESMVHLLTDAGGLGATGEILVGSIEEDRVRYLMPSKQTGSPSAPLANVEPMIAAIEGNHGFSPADYDGKSALVFHRPIEYQSPEYKSWGLVAKIDAVEAYRPLARLGTVLFFCLLILIVLSIGISFWFARSVSQPLLHLAESATNVAEGNLTVRVPLESDDEIGVLAATFNDMTEKLSESYANLENRVAERTEQLEEQAMELKTSNEDLEQFAFAASHDLQEPLRAISGFCQLLSKRYSDELDERGKGYIEHAVEGAQRMQKLLIDLLEFSRVGRRGEAFRVVCSKEIFDQAVSNVGPLIQESGAKITCGRLPKIQCDPTQLLILFQNLLSNGIKYCAAGRRPLIDVSFEDHDGAWVFHVNDNGIGIEEQFRERVFVIFQRLHTREQYSGTGVGLAICKRIVNRHGGAIWVESSSEAGTTMCFTIAKDLSDAA